MRIAEVAPKSKCFSRTQSLDFRISHVICTHNLGTSAFYDRLLRFLHISPTTVLLRWADKRKIRRENKKHWDNQPENKRKRAHKQKAKAKQEIYQERARDNKDGTYGSGVACEPVDEQAKPKKTRKRKLCMCGQGKPHSTSNYGLCARNKKNLQKVGASEPQKSTSDCVSSSHTNTSIDTSKLT